MFPLWEWACKKERARNLRERGLERYHDGRFQGAKCYLTDAKNVCSDVVNSLSSMRNFREENSVGCRNGDVRSRATGGKRGRKSGDFILDASTIE